MDERLETIRRQVEAGQPVQHDDAAWLLGELDLRRDLADALREEWAAARRERDDLAVETGPLRRENARLRDDKARLEQAIAADGYDGLLAENAVLRDIAEEAIDEASDGRVSPDIISTWRDRLEEIGAAK